MRLTRVFVDTTLEVGAQVVLHEAAAGHLLRVLRLQPGDACMLFNGDGSDYDARVTSATKRGATVEVTGSHEVDNESALHVTLLQAVARGEKMDWIVQKATELGVARIVPVFSDRSEVKLSGDRVQKRTEHWRSVAVSACEQSGRARLPGIDAPAELANALADIADDDLKLFLDPEGETSLSILHVDAGSDVTIAIGPEGGWSQRDLSALRAAGFAGLRLGPRVLRTETAGIATIAALQARFGDFA